MIKPSEQFGLPPDGQEQMDFRTRVGVLHAAGDALKHLVEDDTFRGGVGARFSPHHPTIGDLQQIEGSFSDSDARGISKPAHRGVRERLGFKLADQQRALTVNIRRLLNTAVNRWAPDGLANGREDQLVRIGRHRGDGIRRTAG